MRRRPLRSLLAALGLTRPELRAWAFYDWANSAYVTTVIAVLFPIYFAQVAARGLAPEEASARFALASAGALGLVAVLSPFLGALADRSGGAKRLLTGFMLLGVGSCVGLAAVGEGQWERGLVLFALGNVGVTASLVFYDVLLRHLASDAELDRVSTAGYALGYLGGGLLLAAQLPLVSAPERFGLPDAAAASRVAFLTVALWWLLFSLPLLLRVPEVRPRGAAARFSLRATLGELRHTARELGRFRHAVWVLVAYLLYSDGIGTIIRLATLYASQLGLTQQTLILALLLTQAVGVPATALFGQLARWTGTRRALLLTLAVYSAVCLLGYGLSRPWHFYALALLVGLVQGGSQALSRSLFAQLIPRARAGQFFGLFSVFEKVSAVFGPLLFAATVRLTGSSRLAVLSLLLFFLLGALCLLPVDVEAGRRAARAADEAS